VSPRNKPFATWTAPIGRSLKAKGSTRSGSEKHGCQSAEYTASGFTWDGQHLTLAKMEAPLDIRWSRPLPAGCKPTTVTISRDPADRYFVSFWVEEEMAPLPPETRSIGVDLGLTFVVALSTGEKVGNPRFLAKEEKKLAKAQHIESRRKPGSKNRAKARRTVNRIHARIADSRGNFLHHLTTRIIRENQTICVESLAVKNLLKNHTLAKAMSDVGWGELVRQLEYKAAWYGRTLIAIDRYFPSSKLCSVCGYQMPSLPLKIRQWTCPECGAVHDRDVNAAGAYSSRGTFGARLWSRGKTWTGWTCPGTQP
jgi:putative transposase